MRFTFYYQELIGGNRYKESIEANNFREARNLFFNTHPFPHRLEAVFNEVTGEKLV